MSVTGKHGPERRKEKLAGVVERREAREALGDAGQLAKLEGSGHGHTKEAKRLRKRLEK